MTGNIIQFRRHDQLESARHGGREPAPSGRTKRAVRRRAGRPRVDQQIAHIAWLIRELEEMVQSGERLPPKLVAEAHASIERTRKMLQSEPGATTNGKADATGEDATQPNIDHALLERMYSDLGLHP